MRRGLKNSNNESMKLTKSGIDGMRASVVPLGRAGYDTDFPGTSSLAVRCRFATFFDRGGEVGNSLGRSGIRPYRALGEVVRCGRNAGEINERRAGKRGFTALSGREVVKWTGFSHFETALTRLGPDKSTQVVDFPHLAYAGFFREVMKLVLATDGTPIKHGPSGAWKSFRTGTMGKPN